MFEYIVYILVAIVVIFIIKNLIKKGSEGDDFVELTDDRDTVHHISEETKIITGEINKVGIGTVKVESSNKKPASINLICFKNLSDLLKATDIVYSNAEMAGQNIMNKSRFSYYCRLHFRSHLADQLCRKKYDEISAEFSKVNALIVRLNDKNDPLRIPKNQYNQIIQIKDLMKNTRNLLAERSKRLAIQTGIIRDKIGRECGERGHEWWLKRKENAKNAEFERNRR